MKTQTIRRKAREFERMDKGLGEAMRRLRMGAGLTVRGCAALCDVTEEHLSRMERGVGRPSLEVLRALAALPDVPDELRKRFERAVLYPEPNGKARG